MCCEWPTRYCRYVLAWSVRGACTCALCEEEWVEYEVSIVAMLFGKGRASFRALYVLWLGWKSWAISPPPTQLPPTSCLFGNCSLLYWYKVTHHTSHTLTRTAHTQPRRPLASCECRSGPWRPNISRKTHKELRQQPHHDDEEPIRHTQRGRGGVLFLSRVVYEQDTCTYHLQRPGPRPDRLGLQRVVH